MINISPALDGGAFLCDGIMTKRNNPWVNRLCKQVQQLKTELEASKARGSCTRRRRSGVTPI